MSFRCEGGVTILDHRRFAHPLQALEPFRAADGSLCLMMLNISGGMAGGDRLRTSIDLGRGSHAVLITASAAKAYRTEGEPAAQETRVRLDEGTTLEYLPDHLIPHAGAALDQTLRVEMAKGSRAIIYDAIAAGRIGRGERWQFRELTSEVAITGGSRPIYLNRTRITPRLQPLDQIGWMESYNYLATIVIAADGDRDWSGLVAALDAALQGITGVCGSASATARGGCVARLITTTADALNQTALMLWGIARKDLLGLSAFPLRKF
ncbi:MAG: urease accessory protein UreD [Candidatus Binataceae bacterium]